MHLYMLSTSPLVRTIGLLNRGQPGTQAHLVGDPAWERKTAVHASDPWYASSRAAMSIFTIFISASLTRFERTGSALSRIS